MSTDILLQAPIATDIDVTITSQIYTAIGSVVSELTTFTAVSRAGSSWHGYASATPHQNSSI